MYEPAKVAKFEDASLWVEKKVLGFDVSVTDSVGMDVGQRAEQLVHVHLRRRERVRAERKRAEGERERELELQNELYNPWRRGEEVEEKSLS